MNHEGKPTKQKDNKTSEKFANSRGHWEKEGDPSSYPGKLCDAVLCTATLKQVSQDLKKKIKRGCNTKINFFAGKKGVDDILTFVPSRSEGAGRLRNKCFGVPNKSESQQNPAWQVHYIQTKKPF